MDNIKLITGKLNHTNVWLIWKPDLLPTQYLEVKGHHTQGKQNSYLDYKNKSSCQKRWAGKGG